MLLRILQELVGPTQGISTAVQHLPSLLLHGPNALRRLRTHPARLVLHVLLQAYSPRSSEQDTGA